MICAARTRAPLVRGKGLSGRHLKNPGQPAGEGNGEYLPNLQKAGDQQAGTYSRQGDLPLFSKVGIKTFRTDGKGHRDGIGSRLELGRRGHGQPRRHYEWQHTQVEDPVMPGGSPPH